MPPLPIFPPKISAHLELVLRCSFLTIGMLLDQIFRAENEALRDVMWQVLKAHDPYGVMRRILIFRDDATFQDSHDWDRDWKFQQGLHQHSWTSPMLA